MDKYLSACYNDISQILFKVNVNSPEELHALVVATNNKFIVYSLDENRNLSSDGYEPTITCYKSYHSVAIYLRNGKIQDSKDTPYMVIYGLDNILYKYYSTERIQLNYPLKVKLVEGKIIHKVYNMNGVSQIMEGYKTGIYNDEENAHMDIKFLKMFVSE